MKREIETVYYYYIYDNNKDDMVWYSPSSSDSRKCDSNLLNAIEEARRIIRRNPSVDIDIYGHYCEMCGEYEDGDEGSFPVCTQEELDLVERKLKGLVIKFEEGCKYYCDQNSDYCLKVQRRTPKFVTVRGAMTTCEKVMTDAYGDEYIEVSDPIKGTFRYSAKNKC